MSHIEMAEIRFFCCFSHKLSFPIVVHIEKNLPVFQRYLSEKNNYDRFNLWQNKPEYWLFWRKGLNDKSLF